MTQRPAEATGAGGTLSGARIVLVHRYFEPDVPPYASMLGSIARHLARCGADVQVLTSQPSYADSGGPPRQAKRERSSGVEVRRLPLLNETKAALVRRIANLVLFSLQAAVRILTMRPGPKVVMAATTPPVVVATAVSLAARARGAKFIYHCQDIYPEVMGPATDKLGGWSAAAAKAVDRRIGARAERIVVLSSDMARAWSDRGEDPTKIVSINNFDQERSGRTASFSPAASELDDERLRIAFCGNLGRFQNLETLARGIALAERPVEARFVGDGVARQALEQLANSLSDDRFTFTGRVTPSAASEEARCADLAVVSLTPGLIRFVYPSKIFAYLAASTPVLLLVDPDSELAETVRDAGAGVAAAEMTAEGVAHAIDQIDLADCRTKMREAAWTLSNVADREARLQDWARLFRQLVS